MGNISVPPALLLRLAFTVDVSLNGAKFAWTDGTMSNANVERPALLLEAGQPITLFGATDGYRKDGHTSFNVHLPLRTDSKP